MSDRPIEFIRVALFAQDVANNANAAFWSDNACESLAHWMDEAYDRLVVAMAVLRAARSPKKTGAEEASS